MGMTDYRVRDAAHQGSPDPAPTPAAHHYQPGSYLLCQGNDLMVRLTHAQVSLCHLPADGPHLFCLRVELRAGLSIVPRDRKSTRLNSSHANISYAVFCLKKKKNYIIH